MRISESKLRRIIRNVIKESEELGYGPAGSAINNPQIRGDIEVGRQKRRSSVEIKNAAKAHYDMYGCNEPPADPDVKLAWERICEENGEIVWDL